MAEYTIRELEQFIRIDRYKLDDELISMSDHLHKVGTMVGNITSDLDEAKSNLEHIEAALTLQYQEDKDKKLPATQIKLLVHRARAYREALEEFNRIRRRQRRWISLEKAFDQKSKMLRTLVQLFVSEYYSTGTYKGTQSRDKSVRADMNRRALAEQTRRKREGHNG